MILLACRLVVLVTSRWVVYDSYTAFTPAQSVTPLALPILHPAHSPIPLVIMLVLQLRTPATLLVTIEQSVPG